MIIQRFNMLIEESRIMICSKNSSGMHETTQFLNNMNKILQSI